ncbi:putative ATPase [Nocardia tenerifensis]|uniref:Putative ATPase n=1 Tax=Nocardia tenerifensis TaxID=228006 RepID=A0A318KAS4_9NOCA|nr:LuxR C-terminal-related transcriptional regulator [Nocardia tenerifensis]PXX71651.1 putative ATPase [Nocardia tenerifensis]
MGARDRSEGPGPRSAPDAFVGRQLELDQLITLLLRAPRLVTLLGPGGIGKTRLAAEAVARFQRSTGVEVHWARLARLAAGSDANAVAEEIAHAVMETDFSGRSVWQAIVDALAGRGDQVVLVLDNCEHLLEGVGSVVDRLAAEAPNLSIVATSREAIGWIDEHRVPVPPLSREHGVALFQQRSELIGRSVTHPEQAEIMAEICRHVNNHPLYIRLAAARLVREPLPMILRELSGEVHNDQRMRWSDGPRVGADARHRRVRDVISWSYELCDEQERILFERMAVFAAGYDVNPADSPDGAALDVGAEREAIEFVCSDPDDDAVTGGSIRLCRNEIPDVLDRLVDQSLVSVHLTPTTVRYSLLESIRVFAQHRLELRSRAGSDERARLERRHRQYYRDKVVDAATNWFGPAELRYLDWARAAWDNILTAIDRSVAEPGQAAVALDICRGLLAIRLPFLGCSFREIRLWSARTLAASRQLDARPTEKHIETTALVVWIALCQGMLDEAEEMLDECARMCLGDDAGPARWRAAPEIDAGFTAAVEFAWGVELLIAVGDPRSVVVLRRAAEKYRRDDDVGGSVTAELFGALAAGLLGTVEEANALSASFLARVEDSGASWVHSWARLARAVALIRADKPCAAMESARSALTHLTRIRDRWGELWAVQFRIWALARLIQQAQQARDRPRAVAAATEIAQLTGGTKALLAKANMDVSGLGPFTTETEQAVAAGRAVLGETAYAAAEEQGSRLRPERGELQSLALGSLTLNRPRAEREDGWSLLSPAEAEVAILAAAGWTNSAIAVRRGISTRTVDAQVASVLQKLSIGSRAEIDERAPRALRDRLRAEAMRAPGRQQRRRDH